MRERKVTGAAGLLVAGAVTAVAVAVIAGSDATTTRLVVAGTAPAGLPAGPLAASITARWSAPAAMAGESAAAGAAVVVAGADRVTGRDPRTGAERWSYRRGNARLCAWTARDGVVVGVFGRLHGCTDLTALAADTGARRWYRNADLGTTVTLTSANGVVVARSDDQLLAVDTVTGLNRWTARKPGCRYGPVAVGALGAAAVVRCADGRTLVVGHDAYGDTEHFSVAAPGTDAQVLSVDDSIAVLSRVGGVPTLTLYDQRGRVRGTVADGRLAAPGGATGTASGATILVWTGADVVAVDAGTRSVAWSADALGPPSLDGDRVLLAEPGGFVERTLFGGEPARRAVLRGGEPARAAILSRIGTLVVATSPDAVTVYG